MNSKTGKGDNQSAMDPSADQSTQQGYMYQDQPPAYPGVPQHFTYPGQPQVYQGQPQVYPGQPQVYQGQPQVYVDQPQVFQGQPQVYQDQPQVYQGQPQVYQGQPQVYVGQPQVYQGQPQVYVGQPQVYQSEAQVNQSRSDKHRNNRNTTGESGSKCPKCCLKTRDCLMSGECGRALQISSVIAQCALCLRFLFCKSRSQRAPGVLAIVRRTKAARRLGGLFGV
ncbi:IST1-like protein [Entelurus aequoreus]|uniref:IST1-like protein n=1 Tax=Entelurus aequoreus TaxID=161455 RepID=UPI002B1E2308|nr:IST1-like protein [Entelurus aequoreus]